MRKIIHIFLSLVIVYAGTVSAYANTSVGGWSALDVITAGATNTINATKTAGGKVLTSAITIAPQAGKVGKYLLRGGAAGALAMAVPQLIGEGVDWVLDPANNAVKYTEPAEAGTGDGGSVPVGGLVANFEGQTYASPSSLCAVAGPIRAPSSYKGNKTAGSVRSNVPAEQAALGYEIWDCGDPVIVGFWATPKKAPVDGDTGTGEEEKYVPINTVAAQVISNAEAGHGPSQDAVKATALEGFAAGEHDAALDAGAVESDAGTENPPDTTNPDNPDAPAEPAPFDPAGIIAAIAALKALLVGILSSITGLSDFFNDTPPEKTKQETDVPVEAPPDVKNPNEFDVDYIGFSSQCPTLSPFSVAIGGASSSMTFDMTPLCNLAVTIRPAIIAIAYFIGLGVIASAIRET